MNHWKALVNGPPDSVYEGGVFQIDIKIPEKYPYVPPKMQFDTKIWHPNMSSQTGAICLDILKDEWTPALSIRTALLSIQALLTAAEPGLLNRQPSGRRSCKAIQRKLRNFQKNSYRMDKNLCWFAKKSKWQNFKNNWNGVHRWTGTPSFEKGWLGRTSCSSTSVAVILLLEIETIESLVPYLLRWNELNEDKRDAHRIT